MAYATPVSGDDTVRRVITPIDEARGWMKLLSIIAIVGGVLVALSIIGLIIAWLPIWMGVLLWQAAESSQRGRREGDEEAAVQSLTKLKTIFTIQGVIAVIWLALTALALLVGLTAGIDVGT